MGVSASECEGWGHSSGRAPGGQARLHWGRLPKEAEEEVL